MKSPFTPMDSSDPYRSTNPWALARFLKTSCSCCPVCRQHCSFEISVDRDEELIKMAAVCEKCGRTELVPYIDEGTNVRIAVGNTEDLYEPDAKCHTLLESVKDKPVEGADADTLGSYSEIAKIYDETRRRGASVELGKKIAAEYRSNIGKEGWDNAIDKCLAQISASATVHINAGDNKKALELYNEYLPLTENNESGQAFAFILARAFSLFSDENFKEATSTVRDVIASLDRMKSENRIPSDDPFVRSRAYEALGFLLSAKNDKTGSMKAMKKALEDARETLSKNITDDGLRWMNRCSREYAFACHQADMRKRSMEALKDSIKFCAACKVKFPWAYAESLLERAMYISDSGIDLPPYLRDNMTEAIELLGKPDENGKYDPLLPVAYYYRSMTGADKEKLDLDDLEKAYTIIRDGVKSGEVPDSVLSSVVDTYTTYLDLNDEKKAMEIRRELSEMGIWVRPPVKKKEQ
ncbi:MAG: hypothetical protein MJZ21_03220 [archaeon]|nr:hypothetical protein [archaeon]